MDECPKCGEDLLLDFDECPACGEELAGEKAKKKRGEKEPIEIDNQNGIIIEKAKKKIDEKMENLNEDVEVSPPVKEGETYKVRIEDIGKDGDGVAKIENLPVFVEDTDVGDEVRIKIMTVFRTFAIGKVIERDIRYKERKSKDKTLKESGREIFDEVKERFNEAKETGYYSSLRRDFSSSFEEKVKVDYFELKKLDKLFEKTFDFNLWSQSYDQNWPDTELCGKLEDFYEAMFKDLEISEKEKKDIIRAKKAKYDMEGDSTIGVNLPGDGFYINAYPLLEDLNLESVKELKKTLKKNRKARKIIYGTICHEKLGHGFIDFCTLAGKAFRNVQIKKIKLAEEFDIGSILDTEEGIWREKWNCLYENSKFLQEGYATWVEYYMKYLLDYKDYPEKSDEINLNHIEDKYNWKQLEKCLPYEKYNDLRERIKNVKKFSDKRDALITIREICKKNKGRIKSLGQPPNYVVGYLMVKELENTVGTRLVPEAIQLICKVDYDVENRSLSDFKYLLEEEDRGKYNLDIRLLKFTILNIEEKNNLEELKNKVYDELSFPVGENNKSKI